MSTGLALPSPIVLTAPTGSSQLPLIELKKGDVNSARKQIRLRKGSKKRAAANCSFGNFSQQLTVDAWPFFHAAKKTELTTSFTRIDIDSRALFSAAEFAPLFVWNPQNLRRADRSVFALEDFSEAALAGRFGEAIAYLTMQSWGYIYFDRVAVLWERAAIHSGMAHPDRVRHAKILVNKIGKPKPQLEPDFAFESLSGDVALMEAKGSFVHPVNDDPTTKNDLRHGLKQIHAWSGMISPKPAKSFVIGTYFRDESDATGDPSLVAWVDPPGREDPDVSPVEIPSDFIRRGNYGVWLAGMGFTDAGRALRHGIGIALPERSVLVVKLEGMDFAVSIQRVLVTPEYSLRLHRFPFIWATIQDLIGMRGKFLRQLGIAGFEVLGIERSILRTIETAVGDSKNTALLQIQTTNRSENGRTFSFGGNGIDGSLLPDQTFYGIIGPENLTNATTESFKL